MRMLRSLYVQVLFAVVFGALIGHFAPDLGVRLKPLGDGFVKLVKMLIGPVIFCTVTLGLAGMRDLKEVGRVGAKAVIYFEAVTTLALALGILVAHLLKPGAGMNVDPATLDAQSVASYATQAKGLSAAEFLLNVIPSSPIDAFARGDILQILFFSLLFGLALSKLGERSRGLASWLGEVSQVVFKIVGMLMRLAPLGAFGAMAFTIGKYGIGSLASLAKLMAAFYLTCAAFVAIVLGSICRGAGISVFRLIAHLREELLIVLGTSSSESALPRLMDKLERLGCPKPIVGLVVPAGYSFNLDGTSIYLTLAALFIAQAMRIDLSWGQELTILGILLVSSKGAAGVTGSGFVTLAATLAVVPSIPVSGLALILGVDRFMSEARALTNLMGNAVATLIVARWEGRLDEAKAAPILLRRPASREDAR